MNKIFSFSWNKVRWQKTPIIFLASIILLFVLLSLIGGRESATPDFQQTQDAFGNLLIQAENSFTRTSALATTSFFLVENWLKDSDDDPFMGNGEANIIIVEFSDFQCSFCRVSFPIIREFVTMHEEEIKYIYRDWPIDDIHPDARLAAEAGGCAHAQDKFWSYHDRLFQNQNDLSKDGLLLYAKQSGLDIDEFSTCLEEGRNADEVEADQQSGFELGVVGTPTWFINGEKFEGVIPLELWEDIFEVL